MFDIGFFELSLIAVVALVVIGPERLPAVARSAGKWMGRANRFIANIKDDISKELKTEELQNILAQQQQLADQFKQATNSTTATLNKLNSSTNMGDLLEINETDTTEKKKKKKKKKTNKATKQIDSTTDSTTNSIKVEDKSALVSHESISNKSNTNTLSSNDLNPDINNRHEADKTKPVESPE